MVNVYMERTIFAIILMKVFCVYRSLIYIAMCLGGLRRFDAPRELSFLLRIDRCSASQSNDLDGLASSINHVSSLRVLRDALVSERALVRASSILNVHDVYNEFIIFTF